MYPGLQHYVYKLLHLQQGEMWWHMSSCPAGRGGVDKEAGISGVCGQGCLGAGGVSVMGGDHLEAEILGPMVLPVTGCFFFGEEGAGLV